MQARRLTSLFIATLILVAAAHAFAADRSGSTPTPTPSPQSQTPSYFKTGVLTLQDRIWAQTQIERVFYNHRIWPKENPGSKPPFETMVPRAVIAAKVTDSLKKSAALDKFWQHPVTGEMLQAELDRMAKQTRDPATLKELFEALHNDPRLIAETIIRETLSDRLIRNWYAYDTRFHAEARAKAEAIAARLTAGESWSAAAADFGASVHDLAPRATRAGRGRAAGAGEGSANTQNVEYHHQIILLDEHPDRPAMPGQSPDERRVDAEEFAALMKKYSGNHSAIVSAHSPFSTVGAELSSALFPGVIRGARPRGKAEFSSAPTPENASRAVNDSSSRPEETPDHFILTRVIAVNDARIEFESIVIPKTSFARWWEGAVSALDVYFLPHDSATARIQWRLPVPALADGCDAWSIPSLPELRYGHRAVWTGSEMIVWGGTVSGILNSIGGRYNPATDSWRYTGTVNAPNGRALFTAVWSGSEMIIWGGTNFTTNLTDGGRYNPAADSWQPINSAFVVWGRYSHTAVWTGSEMIVWGGAGSGSTGGRYNPSSDSWLTTSIGVNVPSPRSSHTAVWTGSEMIIWGAGSGGGYTGGRYNPVSDSWLPTSLGNNLPPGRSSHTAVWSGSEMIVWGGQPYTTTGGHYNPSSDSWLPTSVGANVPAARYGHTAIWTASEMIIWGGYNGSYLNTGGRYNPAGGTWSSTLAGANVPVGRSNHSAVWTGSEMIVWGGLISNNVGVNTGGRYSPATDTWVPTATGPVAPSARDGHTGIWTGSEMIVFGGKGPGETNTGGRYSPATGSWVATSVGINVPTARSGHTAIWTGSDMIIWGGGFFSGSNTGGRYNPASDTWLATSIGINVPAARIGHTAVWSGSEMIIWGGSDRLYTGGRYNPANDSWQPTSIDANLPIGRHVHTAVWTGSEMIVWGGKNSVNGTFNSGGRYRPASDSWLPTSVGGNVPTARSLQTAIWSGSEMIVWGGGSPNINTGGRYSPAMDSWSPTSTGADVPSARNQHTAVWTGSEMIVWGGVGANPFPYVNTGGRYSPASDSWQSTAVNGDTPSVRSSHTAIWTGSEMIVWGGYHNVDGSTYWLDTGGRYTSGAVAGPGNSLRGGKTSFINLNWMNSTGAGSYNVKRCNASPSCIPATIISTPTINQYSEPDDGISHFYAVEAVNQCGATP